MHLPSTTGKHHGVNGETFPELDPQDIESDAARRKRGERAVEVPAQREILQHTAVPP